MRKEYYAIAAAEVGDGFIDPALMIKAMTLAEGDEQRARARYIQLRAEELEALHRTAKVADVATRTLSAAGNAVAAGSSVASAAVSKATKSTSRAIGATYTTGKRLTILLLKATAVLVVILLIVGTLVKEEEESNTDPSISAVIRFCQAHGGVKDELTNDNTTNLHAICHDGSAVIGHLGAPEDLKYFDPTGNPVGTE